VKSKKKKLFLALIESIVTNKSSHEKERRGAGKIKFRKDCYGVVNRQYPITKSFQVNSERVEKKNPEKPS